MTKTNELDVVSSDILRGFDKLVETAEDYARGAKAGNTNRAYATDWREFTSWCRRRGFEPLPSDPQIVGLYLSALASGTTGCRAMSVASIQRRLSGLAWSFAQRGFVIDRADPRVAEVLAGIRRKHARPPLTKDAVLSDDLLAMLGTLEHDLRGLRDRAILLVGFACALRRSEIVGPRLRPRRYRGRHRLGRNREERGARPCQGQDRLARGRDRPHLQSCDLSSLGS